MSSDTLRQFEIVYVVNASVAHLAATQYAEWLPGVRLRHSVPLVHIEDCEGWWLSGCCGLVAEHWRLKPGVLGWTPGMGLTPGDSWLFFFHFPLFSPHNIYFRHEARARCSENPSPLHEQAAPQIVQSSGSKSHFL